MFQLSSISYCHIFVIILLLFLVLFFLRYEEFFWKALKNDMRKQSKGHIVVVKLKNEKESVSTCCEHGNTTVINNWSYNNPF